MSPTQLTYYTTSYNAALFFDLYGHAQANCSRKTTITIVNLIWDQNETLVWYKMYIDNI
jgi:hypothetical protein